MPRAVFRSGKRIKGIMDSLSGGYRSELDSDIQYLPGVGPKRAALLRSELGVGTFGDLIRLYPFRYIDRSSITPIARIRPDMAYVQIRARVVNVEIPGGKRLSATVTDGSGEMELVFFKGLKWVSEKMKPGNEFIFFGKPSSFNGRINMVHPDIDPSLAHAEFRQGDVVVTVIRCAEGQTIRLTLGTTLPRFYSRNFTVCGTRGMYEENSDSVFLDGDEEMRKQEWDWRQNFGNASRFESAYEHPVWDRFLHDGIRGGHGGMDWLVYGEFFDCLLAGRPFPIDVYDAAAYMVITPLSEQSIATGSMPVAIPDFTGGRWLLRR